MPFPFNHHYVTVIGDCYGATDRWQFGFRIAPFGAALPNPEQVRDAIWDDVQNWWSTAINGSTSFQSTTTHRLAEVKVANIGVDGQYLPGTFSASHFFVPPVVGVAAATVTPIAQNTMVATLNTATPRGLASKGRMFLPPSARMIVDPSDGRVSIINAKALADSIWTLFKGINADPAVGDVAVLSRGKGLFHPAVAPKKRGTYTYPNPGVVNVVTGVQVGRVVDTQRRRRRSLIEAPVAATP